MRLIFKKGWHQKNKIESLSCKKIYDYSRLIAHATLAVHAHVSRIDCHFGYNCHYLTVASLTRETDDAFAYLMFCCPTFVLYVADSARDLKR
jgi:hypothetical protein